MASLFDEDLQTSDSEDDDYVPDLREVSSEDDEEEPSFADDEIKTKKKAKKSEIADRDEKKKSCEESASEKTKADEKQRANDLFKSFLEEVEAETKVKEPSISPGNTIASPTLSSDSGIKSKNESYENAPKKPSCELFDFAGETVAVSTESGTSITSTIERSVSEKEESINLEKSSDGSAKQPPVMKRKGLQAVLGTIMNKKQKLTTLQKTSFDWNLFKNEHAISEELETFNKGRGGYIERQRFLQRSDLRSYEIERDARLSKRKK